jgi:heme exporter protein D
VDLGPHAVFVWASYVIVALVIGGLIAWLTIDGRRYGRRLAELEAQGIRRRSQEVSESARKSESAE